jgi:hypothetical protein
MFSETPQSCSHLYYVSVSECVALVAVFFLSSCLQAVRNADLSPMNIAKSHSPLNNITNPDPIITKLYTHPAYTILTVKASSASSTDTLWQSSPSALSDNDGSVIQENLPQPSNADEIGGHSQCRRVVEVSGRVAISVVAIRNHFVTMT